MKTYTWDMLKKIQKANLGPHYLLYSTPKKYQLAMALALSVVKWSPQNPNRGQFSCGLCGLTYVWRTNCRDGCALVCATKKSCMDWGSLFSNWNSNRSKENADKLYNVLVDLYTKEWEKI